MKYTTNLNLKKPDYIDPVDIEDINSNMDTIDSAIQSKANSSQVLTDVPAGAKFTDTVYTHPAGTNPHGTTKADVGLGNVDNTSDVNKPVSTAQQTAINSGVAEAKTYADGKSDLAIPLTQKGAASGVAELDASGKVLSSQLPSYVDDVLNYTTQSNFPSTGESGKIYITEDTNKTYRWTGSDYVEISSSVALGETSATAYRGDRGKVAYDHSLAAHAPSNAQKNSDITKAEIEAKLTGVVDSHSHTVTKASVDLGNVDNLQQATKAEFNAHNVDAVKHITALERTTWNAKGSSNLALGATSTTAYRGDRGTTAYTHSQSAHAPTNAQKNSDITKAEIEAKLTGAITSHTHSYLSDSPQDGKIYGRKDSSWTEISSGSGADVYDWTWLQYFAPPSGTCTQQQYDELMAAVQTGKIFLLGASVSGYPVEGDEFAVVVSIIQSSPQGTFIMSWAVLPNLNVFINYTEINNHQVVSSLPSSPTEGVFYFVKE